MKLLLISLSIFISLTTLAQSTLTVTNLNDSGPGSLRQQVFNSNSGDSIVFASSLLASGSDTLFLNFPIIVDNSIHIKGLMQGADTLFISGHDSTQVFYMDFTNASGHQVSLDQVAIIDAKNHVQYGSVHLQNGGAILAMHLDTLKITSSLFRNCRVAGNGNGGAIYSRYTNLVIENSSFIGNHTDSILPTGGVQGRGGAIRSGVGSFFGKNVEFRGNWSGDIAGALYLGADDYMIENCLFIQNELKTDDIYRGVLSGGAVYAINCPTGSIIECQFIDNFAHEFGGALSVIGFSDTLTTVVRNCLFLENQTGGDGGAIRVGHSSQVILRHSTFINNQSSSPYPDAGAIGVWHGLVNIRSCTFANNESLSGPSVISRCPDLRISNSTFYGNVSQSGNPSIEIASTATRANIRSSIFHNAPSAANFNTSAVFTSQGNNIFSDAPAFADSTDQVNIDSMALALEPLAMNGGFAPTMIPSLSSVALNAGDPTDFTNAQNGLVFGRRDVGAAERAFVSYDTTLACTPVTWWGNTYTIAGTYSDTAFNANSVDSIGFLVLERQDTSITDIDGTLYANEQDTNTLYQWVDCANGWTAIPGATSRGFLPSSNGSYAVILSNQNCVDTSACFNYNRFSVVEESDDIWITFFPNPSSGELTITWEDEPPSYFDIVDLQGRVVYTQLYQKEVTQLDVSALAPGAYFLVSHHRNGGVQVDRLVIAK